MMARGDCLDLGAGGFRTVQDPTITSRFMRAAGIKGSEVVIENTGDCASAP